ncbi:hypothetical protein AB9M62_02865 [Bacillales bacterium AN1005]
MKDIIRDGHPTLRKVAEEVSIPASKEDKQILEKHDGIFNKQPRTGKSGKI